MTTTRSSTRFLLLTVCFVCVFCAAQAANESAASKNGSISGSVVRSDNSQPLGGVNISLRPVLDPSMAAMFDESSPAYSPEKAAAAYRDRSFDTQTDHSGHFVFSDVPPGNYQVAAEKVGYVGQRPKFSEGVPVTVAAAQTNEVTLQLRPGGAITGRVLNEDGEPMANVSVQALRYQYLDGKRNLQLIKSAETNDLGEYRVFGLAPQKYYLRAVVWGGVRSFRRGEQVREGSQPGSSYAPLFFPDARTPATASRIEVRSGDEQRANFTVLPVRTFRVSGKVIGLPSSAPDSYIWVMLLNKDTNDRERGATLSGTEQSFTLDSVLPGDYMLMASQSAASSKGKGGEGGMAQMPITVSAADVAGLTVTIAPSTSLQLQGKLIFDPPASTTADITKLAVTFDSADSDQFWFNARQGSVEASKILKNGSFTVTLNGSADTLQTHLTANGLGFEDYYTKAVLAGGRDVIDTGIAGASLGPGSTIEIIASPFGARVDGAVLDDNKKPVEGAFVACIPEGRLRSRHELYITDTTNQQGHYVLRGLRPGNYKLYAFDEIDPGAIYSPDFIKPFEDFGESLTVQEKDTITKPLQVLHQTED